jgi:arginine/lysine/histidine/glutamine transport system substrate-binding/permease protein
MRTGADSREHLAVAGLKFAASAESMAQERQSPQNRNSGLRRQRWLWLVLAFSCWALAGRVLYYAWFRQGTDPTWQHLQQSGVVRVCMEAAYPPFEMQDAEGGFSGYDVDLIQELARRWGISAQFINVHFDGLYDALLTDKCDLITSALPYDETLTQDVLYSPSYFNAGLLLAVREDERRIRDVNDLGGRKVSVELGAASDLEARRLRDEARIPLQIVPLPSAEEALQALAERKVDASIADSISIYRFARDPGGIRYFQRFLTDEQYVMAMRPDSGYLWKRIADELARMRKDGFLEQLRQRWF